MKISGFTFIRNGMRPGLSLCRRPSVRCCRCATKSSSTCRALPTTRLKRSGPSAIRKSTFSKPNGTKTSARPVRALSHHTNLALERNAPATGAFIFRAMKCCTRTRIPAMRADDGARTESFRRCRDLLVDYTHFYGSYQDGNLFASAGINRKSAWCGGIRKSARTATRKVSARGREKIEREKFRRTLFALRPRAASGNGAAAPARFFAPLAR